MMKITDPEKAILITKASGETEPFSEAKLRRSLERATTSPTAIEKIVAHIRSELKPGMHTGQIYRHAFSLLRTSERPAAGRYALKRAIMELGPTGRPFEKLIGKLLGLDGFAVTVAQTVSGLCVRHEIDVIGEKDNRHIMVECKFHNQPGTKSDVKVALYIQARFEDVAKAWRKNPGHDQKVHEPWLVTNTKLTSDAIQYAACVGMKAIGWSYPDDNGLEARIDRAGFHPLTALTRLSRAHKQQLLARGFVLCKELLDDTSALRSLGLSPAKLATVKSEITQLCRP